MGESSQGAGRRLDLPRVVTASAALLGVGAFVVLRWADWGSSRDADAHGGDAELNSPD